MAPGLLAKDSDMNTPYNSTLDIMYNSSLCESLCPREGVNQLEIEAYCNNLQYHIAADTHIAMWTAIGVLFVLSCIEAALEACGSFMPCYRSVNSKRTFWCLHIYQNANEIFARISALASKKRLGTKMSFQN